MTTDEEVSAWLPSVGIDPRAVRVRDLARVLSEEVLLPGWARYGREDWRTGNYRLILPLYDLDGQMRHLYARALRSPGKSGRIGTSPPVTGIPGLVMANDVARSLLREDPLPTWRAWPTVVITGGAIDFLDWCSSYHEETGPAVLSLVPGSWTPELATRVPSGARVIVRTYSNPLAERYSVRIAKSLAQRCDVIVKAS